VSFTVTGFIRAIIVPAFALFVIAATSCTNEPTQAPTTPIAVAPTPDIAAAVRAAISATSEPRPSVTPVVTPKPAVAEEPTATAPAVPIASPMPAAIPIAGPTPVSSTLPAPTAVIGMATTTPCRTGRRTPPQNVFLNFEEGLVDKLVTVGGVGFKCGTIVNIWRDANADGFFDVGEEHLAAARVRSDRRFSAIFPVTSPPFVPGEGSTESSSANKVNAVDGEGNTIDPALPAFSADDIPTFKLLTATPTPVPSPYFFKTQLVRAFPNLSFRLQTNLLQPDDETDLIFISELSGRILVFQNDQDTKESRVFLDISGQMYSSAEEGLLGLAFDPDYKDNGRFYVYYAARDPKRLVLSRYSVAPNNRMQANADSELVLMEIPDVSGHDGGQLAFGPDSYLYIGVGDGSTGKRSHPNSGNGQDRSTLRGSLLRIDVSGESDGGAYRIPPDNPFVGVAGAREEIWAYGFRNPWRFSFDRETGNLWLGDVGSHLREEINLIQKGRNYGWSIMEGTHCFEPKDCCDVDSMEPPLVEISRKSFCAVTGGYVFRGREIPPLVGAYVYADFCTGQIFAAWYDGYSDPYHQLILDTALNISSFGQDRAGNLYILSGGRGGDEVDSLHPIYRLTLTPRD